MEIRDVTGKKQNVNIIDINEKMLTAVEFSTSNGRVFKIDNHSYHLTDLMNAIKSQKKALSANQLSRLVTVFSSADEAGYSTGLANKSNFEKKIAGVKHWFSKRKRKTIFNSLVRELVHKGDPKSSSALARHALARHAVLWKCYLEGSGTKQDTEKAREHLKIAANCTGKLAKGNAEAQYLLCSRFAEQGFKDFFGVKRNQLLESAASKNHPGANYKLARHMKSKPGYYLQLKKAADLGSPAAQFDISQSPEFKGTYEMTRWLTKAANQGEPRALKALASSSPEQLLLQSLDTTADKGDVTAIERLARLLGQKGMEKKETDQTVAFLNRHYEQGHLTAEQYNNYLVLALGESRATAFPRK